MKTRSTSIKGFSLIEILLTIAVIATIAIAAFIIFPKTTISSQAEVEAKNAITVMANMQSQFGSKTAGISTGVANQARISPSNMNGGNYSTTAELKSAWGGRVRVTTSGAAAFDLIYQDVTPEVCLKFLPAVTPNFQWVQIQQGAAGGGKQTWIRNPGHKLAEPTINSLINACTQNGDSFVIAVGYK